MGRGHGLGPQGTLFPWEQKECRGREPGAKALPLARGKQGGLPGRGGVEGSKVVFLEEAAWKAGQKGLVRVSHLWRVQAVGAVEQSLGAGPSLRLGVCKTLQPSQRKAGGEGVGAWEGGQAQLCQNSQRSGFLPPTPSRPSLAPQPRQ